jgi:hypothetical protein
MGKIDSQHDLCFRSWSYYLCQTHLSSSKLRVRLHDGVANWWSSIFKVGLAEPEPCQTRPKKQKSEILALDSLPFNRQVGRWMNGGHMQILYFHIWDPRAMIMGAFGTASPAAS